MWPKNYPLQNIQLSKNLAVHLLRCVGQQTVSSSPNLLPSAAVAKAGGEYRDRTGDLLVANQALSQLS